MDLVEKVLDRLRDILGENLTDVDVCFIATGVHLLRCVFKGSPDPDRINEYKFSDEDLHMLERLQVPTYALDLVRRSKDPFYNEEMDLYGVGLNADLLIDEINEAKSSNLASRLAVSRLTGLAELGKLAENIDKIKRTAGIDDDGESVT